MRRLLLVAVACLGMAMAGCDPLKIGKFADSLDKFSDTIDKTTMDGGNLDNRIKQLTKEMRAELVAGGKEVTEYAALQFAIQRRELIEDIYQLTKKVNADITILVREFQGIGMAIPLQVGNELTGFRQDFRNDVNRTFAGSFLLQEKHAPVNYSGLTWTERKDGHYTVKFQIKDAIIKDPTDKKQTIPLQLRIGDGAPTVPSKSLLGEVIYEVPITDELKKEFHDFKKMKLGFTLVEPDPTKGKEWVKRYGGWAELEPRFPVAYTFVVFPTDGPPGAGQLKVIEHGSAVDTILDAVPPGKGRAARQGEIYKVAETRLAVGSSYVEIPQGVDWRLRVTFPDGKTDDLNSNTPRATNEFGHVTVTGPTRNGNVWVLKIDVKTKE